MIENCVPFVCAHAVCGDGGGGGGGGDDGDDDDDDDCPHTFIIWLCCRLWKMVMNFLQSVS